MTAAHKAAVVDLWLASVGKHLRVDQAALCQSILNTDERRAADRFQDVGRRDQALAGRALLRRALTYRLGLAPERWVFENGAWYRWPFGFRG